MSVIDRVLPDPDPIGRAEGWRLHVFRNLGETMMVVAEERVLPEKVEDAATLALIAEVAQ